MKLNNKRTILVGLAFMSICAFWQLYDNIIPLILLHTFHLKDTVSGFIMSLDNILALFMLPFFGALSDRIDTGIGKRMPFIVIGTILASISMLVLPIADSLRSGVVFFIALSLTLFAMSIYRSPAVALMPDITPKPLRSKANAIINLMGAIGGIITLVLITLLVPKSTHPSYFPLFLSIASLMLFTVAILFLTIKEKKLRVIENEDHPDTSVHHEAVRMDPAVKRSMIFLLFSVAFWFMGYNAVTTAFSKYANVVWGLRGGEFAKPMMVATVAAIISYIPVGILSSRFGRKKLIIAGVILLGVSYTSGIFFRTFSPLLNVVFLMVGVAWAMINVNSYPMVVEMSQGGDVGKYTGTYYTFSMAAQVMTPILSGFLLEHVGYWTLFPYATGCVLVALLLFIKVKHGDNRPEQRGLLESFDVED